MELPCDPAILFLGIYPKEMKTYAHIKTLVHNFYSSCIQNSQKVRTAQISINWWKDKQKVMYSCHGILFGHEKEWNACYNIQEPWKNYAKWIKPATKDHILYDPIYFKTEVKRNLSPQNLEFSYILTFKCIVFHCMYLRVIEL